MSKETKTLVGEIGVMYDNTHLTIYKKKTINLDGAKRVFRIIEEQPDKVLVVEIGDVKEIFVKKIKVK